METTHSGGSFTTPTSTSNDVDSACASSGGNATGTSPIGFTSSSAEEMGATTTNEPRGLPPLHPQSKKRKNSKESPVWEHFTRIPLAPEENPLLAQAKCNYCGKLFPCHHKKNGTSGL